MNNGMKLRKGKNVGCYYNFLTMRCTKLKLLEAISLGTIKTRLEKASDNIQQEHSSIN